MEPITATLTTANEVYEAAKTIQKVYNVSKEMKTVAESEGKDQIMATTDLANTATDMKKEYEAEKSQTKNKDLDVRGDLIYEDQPEIPTAKGDLIDRLEPIDSFPQPVEFVDKIIKEEFNPAAQFESGGFVDKLSPNDKIELPSNNNFNTIETQTENADVPKVERNPERFNERNQYCDSDRIREYRDNPDHAPLIEGHEKDANTLRYNMELVMGEDANDIDTSNSRAHHIVGDNEYSGESKAILDKYGIDINSPENGIFLPNNEESDLHGTIHDGKHSKAYNDEVTQRLRSATCKEDVLEILDSIKEDLYNGEMELYNNHKYND